MHYAYSKLFKTNLTLSEWKIAKTLMSIGITHYICTSHNLYTNTYLHFLQQNICRFIFTLSSPVRLGVVTEQNNREWAK